MHCAYKQCKTRQVVWFLTGNISLKFFSWAVLYYMASHQRAQKINNQPYQKESIYLIKIYFSL